MAVARHPGAQRLGDLTFTAGDLTLCDGNLYIDSGAIIQAAPRTVSTDSITVNDWCVLANAVGGALTLTLPTVASASGAVLTVKKIDSSANTVTVDGASGELIDGSTTAPIATQYESITLVCNGSAWYII